MTHKHILKAGASILLLGSVAACGDNNNIADPIAVAPTPTPTPTPTPPMMGSFQSLFGAAFAAIFNRAITEDPVDPQQSDVPPLAPADDPLDNGSAD